MTTKTLWRGRVGRVAVALEFKAEDAWVGAFWTTKRLPDLRSERHVWVCLLPTLPLHLAWETGPLAGGA